MYVLMLVAFFVGLLCAGIASSIGAKNDRECEGAVLGLLFGPLGILVTCFLPPK